jgi:hypothetical protein
LQRKITKSTVDSPFNVSSYIQVWTGITVFEDKFADLSFYKQHFQFWDCSVSD